MALSAGFIACLSVASAATSTPTFGRPSVFEADLQPAAVTGVDLDRDGRHDLVVANEAAGNISVFRGLRGGRFALPLDYGVGSGPNAVRPADIDRDGDDDLLVLNGAGSALTALLGNGDATFRFAAGPPTDINPTGFAIADFDRDGDLDIAVVHRLSDYSPAGDVLVLLGRGDGTFASGRRYHGGGSPASIASRDFNEDGRADLVVAGFTTQGASVLLGHGDGTFTPSAAVGRGQPDQVRAGDLNGDRHEDVVLTQRLSESNSVLLGRGDGRFERRPGPLEHYGEVRTIEIADLNRDGARDLVAGSDFGELLWFRGLGNGTLTKARELAFIAGEIRGITVRDFNRDSRPDVAAVDGYVAYVFLNGLSVPRRVPPRPIVRSRRSKVRATPQAFCPRPRPDEARCSLGGYAYQPVHGAVRVTNEERIRIDTRLPVRTFEVYFGYACGETERRARPTGRSHRIWTVRVPSEATDDPDCPGGDFEIDYDGRGRFRGYRGYFSFRTVPVRTQ